MVHFHVQYTDYSKRKIYNGAISDIMTSPQFCPLVSHFDYAPS